MSDNFERLLKNSIDSIEMGVEDYKNCKKNNNERRIISSIRNIYAGILLLFKATILELSPDNDETLIKKQLKPKIENGKIICVGNGDNTIDFHQIRERFDLLGLKLSKTHSDLLTKIQKYRNDIEHYFDRQGLNSDALQGYIVKSFGLIYLFLNKYIKRKPESCFTSGIFQIFLDSKKEFDFKDTERLELLKSLSWEDPVIQQCFMNNVNCTSCGSFLLFPTRKEVSAEICNFECRDCGKEYSYNELVEKYLSNLIHQNHYEIYKMRNSQVIYTCPECGEDAYDTEKQKCLYCGAIGPFNCSICGSDISNDELEEFSLTEHCSDCNHLLEMSSGED